jgi:hypothetical protein
VGVLAGGPVIVTSLAWVLIVSGAAMVGAGLLAPLIDRLRH